MATFDNITRDYSLCLLVGNCSNVPNTSSSIGNDSFANVTSPTDVKEAGVDTLSYIAVAAVALFGSAAVVLNATILLVVVKGNLVRKDYRIIYYAFISGADFLYGVHTVLLVPTMVFRQVQFFKEMPVCLLIQGTGLTSYVSSACCILLLVVDLIRGILDPHAGTLQRKKLVAVVTCCCTWVVGGLLTYAPFSTWYDPSRTLEFCSIANVYGPHFSDYNFIAVCTLSTLFLMMALLSAGLLYQIKAMQMKAAALKTDVNGKSNEEAGDIDVETETLKFQNKRQTDQNETERKELKPLRQLSVETASDVSTGTHASVETEVSLCLAYPQPVQIINTDVSKMCAANQEETSLENGDEAKHTGKQERPSEKVNENMIEKKSRSAWKRLSFTAQKQRSEAKLYKVTGTVSAVKDPQTASLKQKQSEQQRKKYMKACKTVGLFIVAYVGCLMPYYIVMMEGVFCSSDCDTDHPTRRAIRVLCALAAYCLPVINPILYTSRFAIFRKASVSMLSDICCFCRRK